MAAQEQGTREPPIPALSKEAKRLKSMEEKKAAIEAKKSSRKEKKKAFVKSRIYIGTAFEHWRRIKQSTELKTDAEVALLLLDR